MSYHTVELLLKQKLIAKQKLRTTNENEFEDQKPKSQQNSKTKTKLKLKQGTPKSKVPIKNASKKLRSKTYQET